MFLYTTVVIHDKVFQLSALILYFPAYERFQGCIKTLKDAWPLYRGHALEQSYIYKTAHTGLFKRFLTFTNLFDFFFLPFWYFFDQACFQLII